MINNEKLRFGNFNVPYIVDETLREGVERCAFPISVASKIELLKKMTETGLREFIVGCGPEEPEVWEGFFKLKENKEIPEDTEATFIVLLNCWETAINFFSSSNYKKEWIEETVFSFGMINYKEKEKTLEKTINSFKKLGAKKFKASILNNFRGEFTENKFIEICRQIDMALELGVSVIRINDSVGSLQPHTTHELCGRLVEKYPNTTFCLHAHNDTGLAVANTMASIQAGFQMIEGSLAGFGNHSGIAPIEQVVHNCYRNNISLGQGIIDTSLLNKVSQEAEDIFMQVPNIFRPVSGKLETDSNFGVLNIPDYLETKDEKRYFVNYPELHPITIKMALEKEKISLNIDKLTMKDLIRKLQKEMSQELKDTQKSFEDLKEHIDNFYIKNSWTTEKLAHKVSSFISQ